MKVLQIGKYYYPIKGGIEKVVYDIATGLNDKLDMKVLVSNTKFKKSKDMIKQVEVIRSARLTELFSMPILPRFIFDLKNINADIYHYHLPFPIGVLSDLMLNPNGKTLVTWHSDIIKQKIALRFYKPFLIKFLNKVDNIVVTSPNIINDSPFLSRFKDKCTVIPLGIKPDKFIKTKSINKKTNDIKSNYDKPIILFIGRLVYYKGIEYLIKAMKNIEAILLIGGTGPLEGKLKTLVKDLNLENKVDFLDFVKDEDLPAYYHACDLFVLPSIAKSEAFGIVQLEAQACGKPVVSTNLTTGVPYANKHKETGLIVEPKSVEQLKNAINKLLLDEDLRLKLGKQAKARVNRSFTIDKMTESYLELYKSLI
jgi:rhamnosyl/mannosyltransferase